MMSGQGTDGSMRNQVKSNRIESTHHFVERWGSADRTCIYTQFKLRKLRPQLPTASEEYCDTVPTFYTCCYNAVLCNGVVLRMCGKQGSCRGTRCSPPEYFITLSRQRPCPRLFGTLHHLEKINIPSISYMLSWTDIAKL